MEKDGKYRFTLQFSSDSEEKLRAGEFLESLGNKKSLIIVAALNDYLRNHPELQNNNCTVEIKIATGYDAEKIERLVRTIVEEKLAAFQSKELPVDSSQESIPKALEEDVASMLDNLELFN